jgi:hypothetical protein
MNASAGFLDPLVDIAALAIIMIVLYRLQGQRIPQYHDAKVLLVLTDIGVAIIVAMELLSNFYTTNFYLNFESTAEPMLIFANAILLITLSYVIYVRPPEPSFVDRLKTFLTKRAFPHGIIIMSLVGYALLLDAYLIISRPFQLTTLPNIVGGGMTNSTVYNNEALVLFIPVMVIFLVYPSVQLFLAARRLTDRAARREMLLLLLGLLIIGPALIGFDVLAETLGYDAYSFGFLIITIAFIPSSTVFRGASALASFFGPVTTNVMPETQPFTNRLKGDYDASSLQGESVLMQFDPSTNYEDAVRDFVVEEISRATPTYIFTSKGSPIHASLSNVPEARFFLITESVSYSKEGERPYEILLPRNDQAVILDVLERTISSSPGSGVAVVFDSISDLILYDGVAKTYKFLKQAHEILGERGRKVTALFLMASAVEDRPAKLVMGLFQKHLRLDRSGVRVTK